MEEMGWSVRRTTVSAAEVSQYQILGEGCAEVGRYCPEFVSS